MALWRRITRGIHALTRGASVDQDLDDELAHYLDELTATFVARGLLPAEARRAARAEMGSLVAARQTVRESGWESAVETLVTDVRYGARRLLKDRGFSIVTIATLALGIGASATIFSAANPVLFAPLPYPDSRRLVSIWDVGVDGARIEMTFGSYREIVERSRSFEALAVMRPWQPTLLGGSEPERLAGQRVSSGYFRVYGFAPLIGRDFTPADDAPNAAAVVIISAALHARRFGSDAAIGRPMLLDGRNHTIVGVMPPSFEDVMAPSAQVWMPLKYDPTLPPDGREWGHHLRMIGRLQPGVGVDLALRDVDGIARAPVSEFVRPRWASMERGLLITSLRTEVSRVVKPALLSVLVAVLVLLVIACVNVTGLAVGRGVQRRHEFTLRTALGAGRMRCVREILVENCLLAAVGGFAGLLVARFGVGVVVAFAPALLPRLHAIRIDAAVVAFAAVLTIAAGVAVGLATSLAITRGSLQPSVRQGSGGAIDLRARVRETLVVVEVSLALVLLVGAGLLLRSVQKVLAVEPGFRADSVLTLQVQTSGPRFGDDAVTRRFFEDVLESVRALPTVSNAALTSQLPLSGDSDRYGVHFESALARQDVEDRSAFRYAVSPDYFDVLGIPLRRGRLLDRRDAADGPGVVLISESLAKKRFPTGDAVGQRLRIGPQTGRLYEVVGVVGDVRQESLAGGFADAVYVSPVQWHFADSAMWLVVFTTSADAAAIAPEIRHAIWSVDRNQPIVRIATLTSIVAASAADRRFASRLFELFAAAALLLSAVGTYGLLWGRIAERTREIGVRAALGASRTRILRSVVGQAMVLAALGIVIGLAGAAAGSRALGTLLFGVSPLDPFTYAGVVIVILTVTAVASWIPAWRAASIDPVIALKVE